MLNRTAIATVGLLGIILACEAAWAQHAPQQPPTPLQGQVQIGVAAAVHGTVQVSAAGQAVGQVVQSGKPIFLGDVVTTDGGGHLQILLLDETVFTIGPNSAIVIDEFIYDPSTHDGQVAAQVVKGTFRFVTGKIAHKEPDNMKVDLPAGTIGVRGTMVAGRVEGDSSMVCLLGPGPANQIGATVGRIEVGNDVEGTLHTVTVSRPGFGTTIEGIGIPPTPPAPVPVEVLASLNADLSAPAAQPQEGEQAEGRSEGATQGEGRQGEQRGEGEGREGDGRPGPGMMMHEGEPGQEGPPSAEQLQDMHDAGMISDQQLTQMLTDLEAWESGDPETRAALTAKYEGEGDHDGPTYIMMEDGSYVPMSEMHNPMTMAVDSLNSMLEAGDISQQEFNMMMTQFNAWQTADPSMQMMMMEQFAGMDFDGMDMPFFHDAYMGDFMMMHDPSMMMYDPSMMDNQVFQDQYGTIDDSFQSTTFFDPTHTTTTADQTTTQAAQDSASTSSGVLDGMASFDQLRTIQNGVFNWTGSGSFNQTMPQSNTGTMTFKVNIDFGARTFGGGNSQVTVNTPGVGGISDSISIQGVSFNSLGGSASFNQVDGPLSATLDVKNSNGIIGNMLDVTATYNDGIKSGSGTASDSTRESGPAP